MRNSEDGSEIGRYSKLEQRIENLERVVSDENRKQNKSKVTRRGILGALGVGGLATVASQPASASQDLTDDEELYFGSDNDFSLRYDSSDDVWALRNERKGTDEWVLPATSNAIQSDHVSNILGSPLGNKNSPVPRKSHFEGLKADIFNNIRIAHTADDIQKYIDELEGTGTANDNPGGGIVLLKRKYYRPNSPIILKRGVFLVGQQRTWSPARDDYEWKYSAIVGTNIDSGNPVIKTQARDKGNGDHSGLINLCVVVNDDDYVHGVRVNAGGAHLFDKISIDGGTGNGFWTRGARDCILRNSTIGGGTPSNDTCAVLIQSEDNSVGSGSYDTQINIVHCRIGSKNTALRYKSSVARVWPFTRISSHNTNNTGIPAVHIKSESGKPLIMNGVNLTGYRDEGVHAIRNEGSLVLQDTNIEKFDVGINQKGTTDTIIGNSFIHECLSHGMEIHDGSWMPQVTNARFDANGGDGIRIDGAKAINPITSVALTKNSGYGLNILNIRGGEAVPTICGVHFGANDLGPINNSSDSVLRGSSVGYVNQNSGYEVFDGGVSTFTFSHNMDETPDHVDLAPKSIDATGDWMWSATSTDVTITYTETTPTGLDNIKFSWRAYGPSSLRRN